MHNIFLKFYLQEHESYSIKKVIIVRRRYDAICGQLKSAFGAIKQLFPAIRILSASFHDLTCVGSSIVQCFIGSVVFLVSGYKKENGITHLNILSIKGKRLSASHALLLDFGVICFWQTCYKIEKSRKCVFRLNKLTK